jgi:DNA-binding PadR family transcriptional regulator
MMRDNDKQTSPLSPALFHILIALAGHDLHGYAIMQEISRQTEGEYTLGPGTLYDNLQKAIRRRWVVDLGHRAGDDDPRRRYYRLTSLGTSVFSAEVSRLENRIRDAKVRLRIPKPRRA